MKNIEHIYLHIPFCDSKCPYCDFYSISSSDHQLKTEYVKKLLKELDFYDDIISKNVRSIYIGGGTPNSLSIENLIKLFSGLNKKISLNDAYEFTIEVNPGSITEEKLKLFKQFGINRLSIGSQSFLQNELKTLGRKHSPQDIYRTFEISRKVGIDNINLDLIFSIPGQTINSLIYSLNKILDLDPEHLSAYMLTFYEGTKFHNLLNDRSIIKIDDDTEVEYYNFVQEILISHNYEHYELSNFCKPNRPSNHNLNTWNFGNYLGLGPSAHSFSNNMRWSNQSNVKNYIDNNLKKYPNRINLSLNDKKNEFIMLGLRKIQGIDINLYYEIFQSYLFIDFKTKLERYLNDNILIFDKHTLFINPKYINIYNTIVSDIMLD